MGEGKGCACVRAQSLQSCLTLCTPMDSSLPRPFCLWDSPGKNTGYWSALPYPPPGDLPDPGIGLGSVMSPALAGRFFTTSAIWEPLKVRVTVQ